MGRGGAEWDEAVSTRKRASEAAVDSYAGWGVDSGGELMGGLQVFGLGGADECDLVRRIILSP